MRSARLATLLLISSVLLSACTESPATDSSTTSASTAENSADATEYRARTELPPEPQPLTQLPKEAFNSIEWIALLPEMDLLALQNPPESLNEIEDGSAEDVIASQLSSQVPSGGVNDSNGDTTGEAPTAFQQALVSTSVVNDMEGQHIKLPGFIVPLEFDDDQTITEFFLVPYFGACLHLPPPPPNQIIYIHHPEGVQVDALYDPFWLYGTLETGIVENSIAKSAYRLRLQHIEPYYE